MGSEKLKRAITRGKHGVGKIRLTVVLQINNKSINSCT